MTDKKRNLILIFSLFLFIACLSAATYAYIIFSINVTNASYNSMTACFDVDYDITNDDGTLPITGTLFHSATPKGGLSGKVALGINSTCKAGGTGTINLNVKSGGSVLFQTVRGHCENTKTLQTVTGYETQTACESVEGTQWVTTGTALKYAIYEDLKSEPVSVGYVTGTGIISVYDNIVLSHTMKTIYIYIWLDGELTDNSYADIAFNSSVESTVEYAQWLKYDLALDLYNNGILQVGDFINYELGEWTEEKMSLIKTGHINSLVSANNQYSLPNTEFQFGGFVVGSVIGNNSFADWLITNYGYKEYLTNANTLEDISGWRLFDVEEDGSIVLISAGNPENYVHPYANGNGYISDYILTGNINDKWNVTTASNYKIRNWNMYKNTEQYATNVEVLTKSRLEKWYSKYIIKNADILNKQTFRLIYDLQYQRYYNLIDNWSYYWLPGFGDSSRMYCVVPEDREVASPPQTFAFGIRILIVLSPETLIIKEPVDKITVTTNSDDYHGDELLDQTYNCWDIY